MTAEQASKSLGIALSSYSMIENGNRQRSMTLPFALALANVLQLTVEEVIAREGLR